MSADRTFGLLAALVSGVAIWFAIPPVDAAEVPVAIDQVGWWTDRPVAPAAGDGAFEVAAGIDGAVQSVAAFRVSIAAQQVDSFALTLVETAGLGGQLSGSLAVCTTTDDWSPADPGALADAPEPDCSKRVFLTAVLEERTWIGDIATLVPDGGTVSFVVLPDYAPPSPAPIGPGMVVRVAEIQIAAEGSDEPTPTTTTTLDFATPGGGNQFEEAPDSGFSAGPAPVVDIPSGGTDQGPTVIEEPVDTTTEIDGDLAADDEFFTLDPGEAGPAERRPWARLLVLVPLSAGIGFGSSRVRRMLRDGGLGASAA